MCGRAQELEIACERQEKKNDAKVCTLDGTEDGDATNRKGVWGKGGPW